MIKPDKVARYTVHLKVVRVKLTSVPFDAQVFFAREPRGHTPVLLPEVPAGRYEVVFRKKGFKDSKIEVDIDFDKYKESGEAQVVAARLEPLPVEMTFGTKPSDALVFINGEEKGETSLVLEDLLPGKYKVEFKLEGYQSQTQDFEIKPATPHKVTAQLKEFKAHADYIKKNRIHGLMTYGSALGAAGLIAGSTIVAGMAALAKSNADEQDSIYRSAVDPSVILAAKNSRDDYASSYSTRGFTSITLGLLGVAAGGFAGYLFITPPKEPDYTTETEVLETDVVGVTPFYNPQTGAASVSALFVF